MLNILAQLKAYFSRRYDNFIKSPNSTRILIIIFGESKNLNQVRTSAQSVLGLADKPMLR